MVTDVLSGDIGLRTSVAQNRHLVVINPGEKLQGLSPDAERRMSTAESLGDEFFRRTIERIHPGSGG